MQNRASRLSNLSVFPSATEASESLIEHPMWSEPLSCLEKDAAVNEKPEPVLTQLQAKRHVSWLKHQLSHGTTRRVGDGSRRLAVTAIAVRVYYDLLKYVNWKTGACFPSARTLARRQNCSPNAVLHAYRLLACLGLIDLKFYTKFVAGRGERWHTHITLLVTRRQLTNEEKQAIMEDKCSPIREIMAKRNRSKLAPNLKLNQKLEPLPLGSFVAPLAEATTQKPTVKPSETVITSPLPDSQPDSPPDHQHTLYPRAQSAQKGVGYVRSEHAPNLLKLMEARVEAAFKAKIAAKLTRRPHPLSG